jgi:hypothetical protein
MPAELFKEAHETPREDARPPSDWERRDDIAAAASSCPAFLTAVHWSLTTGWQTAFDPAIPKTGNSSALGAE